MDVTSSYADDRRSACKYGAKCYQKNPGHLSKYKHPSTPKRESKERDGNQLKKHKQDTLSVGLVGEEVKYKDDGNNTDITEGMAAYQKKEEISDNSDSEPESRTSQNKKNVDSVREKVILPDSSKTESDSGSPSCKDLSEKKILNRPDSNSSRLPSSTDKDMKSNKELDITFHSEGQAQSSSAIVDSLSSPKLINKIIKDMFLVEMPDDFFKFWEFCKSLSKQCPQDALKSAGLTLVGPFDVLAGKFNNYKPKDSSLYLTHWRYYYDPPEFQTVLKGDDKTQFHIGYFRDNPNEAPCFLASNCAAKECIIIPMAENIFAAVNSYLESSLKTSNPFQKVKITSIQKALVSRAKHLNYDLSSVTPAMKKRSSKVVTKSFHGAGIVVPVAKKTDLGYRELIVTDANLKKILKSIVESETDKQRDFNLEKLQPIITAANIANDECDFGTSLELGIDLFSFGSKVFHRSALQLLKTAYILLQRSEFAQIVEAHLENRQHGVDLSIIK